MRNCIWITGMAALIAGCTSMDGGASGNGDAVGLATSGDMQPTDRAGYVTMAGASDLYEIQSSQMAVSRAQRPEVRQFAEMLIQHHNQTTAQVTAAARAAGMQPPPPRLLPMHEQMIAELSSTSSAAFDAAYLAQQVPAHEMALTLHRNYAHNGDTPALKAAAQGAVPIVQDHLQRARTLRR